MGSFGFSSIALSLYIQTIFKKHFTVYKEPSLVLALSLSKGIRSEFTVTVELVLKLFVCYLKIPINEVGATSARVE